MEENEAEYLPESEVRRYISFQEERGRKTTLNGRGISTPSDQIALNRLCYEFGILDESQRESGIAFLLIHLSAIGEIKNVNKNSEETANNIDPLLKRELIYFQLSPNNRFCIKKIVCETSKEEDYQIYRAYGGVIKSAFNDLKEAMKHDNLQSAMIRRRSLKGKKNG